MRIEDMEIEAATLTYHHDMCNSSNMWPGVIVIFHVRLLVKVRAQFNCHFQEKQPVFLSSSY